MFIDFLASISFYVIPYLTGRLFTVRFFYAYMLGALFWFFSYFIASYFAQIFYPLHFSAIIKALAISISVFSFINILMTTPKPTKLVLREHMAVFFILALSSLVYFLIWKNLTPYPLQLNWDIYEHIALANKISEGYISFLPSQISDTFTFNGYSPIFHVLLSLPKIIFTTNLLGVYWWLEYWHYMLTVLAAFFLAQRLFDNKQIASICAILSALIFESTVVYGSLFLLPQTLSALMAIFAIIIALDRKKNSLLLYAMTLTILFLTHYIVGILAAFVVGLFLVLYYKPLSFQAEKAVIAITTLFLIGAISLHVFGGWSLTNREEAGYFGFSLLHKMELFLDWYGALLAIFLPLGAIRILSDETHQKTVLIAGIFLLAVSLAPFSYVLKFFVLGRYFINAILALGIWFLISYLPKIGQILALTFLAIVFLIVFYANQAFYKEPLYFKGVQSHVSKAEIEASNWLSKNAKEDTFLVSDPSTQYVLEALSGVNTQGGSYMTQKTRDTLFKNNYLYDTRVIAQNLKSIQDLFLYERKKRKNTLFVLTGRYFAWQKLPREQKMSFYYNIWKPHKLEKRDLVYVNLLLKNSAFKVLYRNDEIIIVQI